MALRHTTQTRWYQIIALVSCLAGIGIAIKWPRGWFVPLAFTSFVVILLLDSMRKRDGAAPKRRPEQTSQGVELPGWHSDLGPESQGLRYRALYIGREEWCRRFVIAWAEYGFSPITESPSAEAHAAYDVAGLLSPEEAAALMAEVHGKLHMPPDGAQ